MDLEQLCGCDGLLPVLLNEQPQFLAGVDAARLGSRVYQSGFGCFIGGEKDSLIEHR